MGGRHSVVAENPIPNRGYDVVIRIEDIDDALLKDGGGGWQVEIVNEATRWTGKVIGVLGMFNRGKTFVLNKLAGAAFTTGDTDDRATYGLSLKSMTLNHAQYIIADSAGLHRPVSISKVADATRGMEELLNRHAVTEDFLYSLLLTVSDYIILVVNQWTRLDQDFLFRIIRERQKSNRTYKEIFVVHNLRTTNSLQDLQAMWGEIQALVGSGTLVTTQVTLNGRTEDVQYIQQKEWGKHVILGNQTTLAHHNEVVFSLLRTWILIAHLVPQPHKIDGISDSTTLDNMLLTVGSTVIKEYVDNVRGFRYDKDQFRVFIDKLIESEQLVLKPPFGRGAVELRSGLFLVEKATEEVTNRTCAEKIRELESEIESLDLTYTEVRKRKLDAIAALRRNPPEKLEHEMLIRLQLPGVSVHGLKMVMDLPKRMGWGLRIFGNVKGLKGEVIEFEELIEIPNEYRRIGPDGSIIPPELIDFQNGIFTLSIPRISLSGWHQEEADKLRREREEKLKQEEDARQLQQNELDMEAKQAMDEAHNVWMKHWRTLHTLFRERNEEGIRALIQEASVNDLMEMFPVLIQLPAEKRDRLKPAIVEAMLRRQHPACDFIVDMWARTLVPQQYAISANVRQSVDWLRKVSNADESSQADKIVFSPSGTIVKLQHPIIVPGCGAEPVFTTRSYQCEKEFPSATKPKLIVFFNTNNPPNSNRLIFKPDALDKDVKVLFLFKLFNHIWEEGFKDGQLTTPFVATFKTIMLANNCGFIEFLSDSRPLENINWNTTASQDLHRLIPSAAGAFTAGYVVSLLDRHKDNLLMSLSDEHANLWHIDFGFVLGESPRIHTDPLNIPSAFSNDKNVWHLLTSTMHRAYKALMNSREDIVENVRLLFDDKAAKCVLENLSDPNRFKQEVHKAPDSFKRWLTNVWHTRTHYLSGKWHDITHKIGYAQSQRIIVEQPNEAGPEPPLLAFEFPQLEGVELDKFPIN